MYRVFAPVFYILVYIFIVYLFLFVETASGIVLFVFMDMRVCLAKRQLGSIKNSVLGGLKYTLSGKIKNIIFKRKLLNKPRCKWRHKLKIKLKNKNKNKNKLKLHVKIFERYCSPLLFSNVHHKNISSSPHCQMLVTYCGREKKNAEGITPPPFLWERVARRAG